MAKVVNAVQMFPSHDSSDKMLSLTERETDELVIALVGPVGSGVSTTAEEISTILKNSTILKKEYGYQVQVLGVSDLIATSSSLVDVSITENETEDERVRNLQSAGTSLRKTFGAAYLAEKCVDIIARHRLNSGGYEKGGGELIPKPRRQAYIIDSLKNPEEVKVLYGVYGGLFWLFGIFAPEEVRKDRLQGKGATPSQISRMIEIDQEEELEYGQRVRDTIKASDFFIRNDGQNRDGLQNSISRYLKIIFGTEIMTPKQDEAAMYVAASSAAGFACLSRQVGAAIYNNEELIGKGRNDVSKAHGGLYCYQDGDEDHRCHKWLGKICHNDERKKRLYNDIHRRMSDLELLRNDISADDVVDVLKKTDIKNLIEFSRAMHAEMDAIISVARTGKGSVKGATLYCTTFPCHSCARHIVASGIGRVVYIEPYPKSLALDLHKDAISIQDRHAERVVFVQFDGVAPKNMLRLFEYRSTRKKDGKAVTTDPATASPVSRSPLDGYYRREQIIVHRLLKLEGTVAAKKGASCNDRNGKEPAA